MSDQLTGYRALFAVVYTASVSSIYFALGIVAKHANGLTPEVLLVSGLFFQLCAMSYVEAASLHSERGGSAVFARYAFNELVSFVAGWSIVLDYTILIAITTLSVPAYLAAFWSPLGHRSVEIVVALAVIAFVAVGNLTGVSARRLRRRIAVTGIDLVLQAVVIVLGFVLAFHPSHLTASVHLGSAPSVSSLLFALPIAVIAFTGLEVAAGLTGDMAVDLSRVKRLIFPGSLIILVIYVGIAVIAVAALPVHHGVSELGTRNVRAPLLGVVSAYHPHWLAEVLKYAIAIGGALALTAAAGSGMLGVSRVGYSLATNRQIPSAVGRLHGRFGTPYVIIVGAAVAAAALVIPTDRVLLVGIFAFGALISFTIAHLSVIALRFREPDRPRGYRVPLSIRLRGGSLPLPAVLGAAVAMAGWVAVVVYHQGARYVGAGWLLGGLLLYVIYRKTQDKPLLRRITIPERALRHEAVAPDFGSILVPIFGNALDDDIVQTAGRLAGETHDDVEEEGAVIEAIWVFEIPLSLPLDAPLPDAQLRRARQALARAKQVGEEYEGVEVATATVRSRRAGQAIVSEARRRGVEAIVLAAEEPSRVRGGALLGGVSGPLENYVGEITKYVIRKAPCRVILTAPPEGWERRFQREEESATRDGYDAGESPQEFGGGDHEPAVTEPAVTPETSEAG